MPSFLDKIMAQKLAELETLGDSIPWSTLAADLQSAPRPQEFVERLDPSRLAVIAEVKRASPSKGDIAPDLDATVQARRYLAGRADAISVLIDEAFYRGNLADLQAVRAAVSVPLLAKDFILDFRGLVQARLHGADMVLLIVAVVGAETLPALLLETAKLGMTPLVEVYTEEEARVAIDCGAPLIGINNRDLHTFDVSLETTERLAPLICPYSPVFSLSGIKTVEDAERIAQSGARGVLVGEALVRSDDPARLIQELRHVSLPPETVRRESEREV